MDRATVGAGARMTRHQQVLNLLRDYQPLPLTYADLEEELALTPGNAREITKHLARHNLIRRWRGPDNTIQIAAEPDAARTGRAA